MKELLKNYGIDKLNQMQLEMGEKWDVKKDMILLSPTGSGKTLAFLLPLIAGFSKELSGVQAMIIVPARELAIQIEQVFKKLNSGYKVNVCYGGHSTGIELNNLSHPPSLLIGTPGRIAYHIRKRSFDASTVKTLILDEFDKSLEMGFESEMSFIIDSLPALSHRILTSATDLVEIPSFTGVHNEIRISFLPEVRQENSDLALFYIKGKAAEKFEILFKLICEVGNESTIVFCNHRDAVDRISEILKEARIDHDVFHGGLEQDERERALIKFRNESHRILVTTDLASRGLDIPEVRNIIHYQLPPTIESFTHRNGRTARMNAKGAAYLVLSENEHIPGYIKSPISELRISDKPKVPRPAKYITLYIGAGKKTKINKVDIVGFLMNNSGRLKDDIGRIEVLDNSSYVAIARDKIKDVMRSIKDQKIKNRKIKVEVSY